MASTSIVNCTEPAPPLRRRWDDALPHFSRTGPQPGFLAHLVADCSGPVALPLHRGAQVEAGRAYAASALRLDRRMPSGYRRALSA